LRYLLFLSIIGILMFTIHPQKKHRATYLKKKIIISEVRFLRNFT
jgi:hypothetical protein